MSQSSDGSGGFMSLFHEFKKECLRYAKQKRLPVSTEVKMYSMAEGDVNAEQLTADTFSSLILEFDTFICGADGLVWLREGVIVEASSLINLLIDSKKQVIILTNDTTQTRENHERKLAQHRFSTKLTKPVPADCIQMPRPRMSAEEEAQPEVPLRERQMRRRAPLPQDSVDTACTINAENRRLSRAAVNQFRPQE